MRASSGSHKRNGMRARFANRVFSTVRADLDCQLEKQTSPLQTGGVSVARQARGCASSTRAAKRFNRRTRASCSFHQPRPNSTGVRSSEVPDVCSTSTSWLSSSASRFCPARRKFSGKSRRSPDLPSNGSRKKSPPFSAPRYKGTSLQRGSNSLRRENCAVSRINSGVANIVANIHAPNRRKFQWIEKKPKIQKKKKTLRASLAITRREIKSYLALLIHDQIGGKRFAGLGRDELAQQVGLLAGQKFLHLLAFDWLLQDRFPDAELARLGVELRLLAQETFRPFKNLAPALRTFAQRSLAGEINLRLRLAGRSVLGLSLPLTGHEFKLHLALFEREERLEFPLCLVRDETLEQIRFALGEQLGDLRRLDGLLQNDFAGAELAGLLQARLLFAHVIHATIEHPRATNRTFAERLLAGEIHGRRSFAVFLLIVAEIKFELELGVHFQHRGEGPARLLAHEPLQRPDLLCRDERLDFRGLKHPAAKRFPD